MYVCLSYRCYRPREKAVHFIRKKVKQSMQVRITLINYKLLEQVSSEDCCGKIM